MLSIQLAPTHRAVHQQPDTTDLLNSFRPDNYRGTTLGYTRAAQTRKHSAPSAWGQTREGGEEKTHNTQKHTHTHTH